MNRFAFLIHPLKVEDVARKYPALTKLPVPVLEWVLGRMKPFVGAHITGVRSKTGAEIEGWFTILPRVPRQIVAMPTERAYDLITRCGELGEAKGAQIFGMGAFSKVVGDKGETIARRLNIPVTTGNSYTTATAVRTSLMAAEAMRIDPRAAQVTVLGATGAIGKACCHLLADRVSRLRLVARDRERLERLRSELARPGLEVDVSTDAPASVRDADIVIAVTSATGVIIAPGDLKSGAVVCDVARPRNLSAEVHEARRDVLVIDGGVIKAPGENVQLGMSIGLPPGCVEACIAETMILALEGRFESFTLGGEITTEQVLEIDRLAAKHGFEIAGFRRFERAVSAEEIEQRRRAAVAAALER